MIDSHLNWKPQITYISKKIKRNIGLLSKIRYFVNLNTLINLYYSLIYPFLIYGIVAWGNTYTSTLNPIFILQKRVIRILTFSDYKEHTNPLFKTLAILKLPDLVFFYNAILMYDFRSGKLPSSFDNFFLQVCKRHHYNTRLASKYSYSLPSVRNNYGNFNIRFQGAKVWNLIDENL